MIDLAFTICRGSPDAPSRITGLIVEGGENEFRRLMGWCFDQDSDGKRCNPERMEDNRYIIKESKSMDSE
jgi:hypothetical protein